MPANNYYQQLCENGYVVVPLLTTLDKVRFRRDAVLDAVRQMPEFTPEAHKAYKYVGGSFGALGNPSSFHLPPVNELRNMLWDKCIVPTFAGTSSTFENAMIQTPFDRLSVRPAGTKIPGESWHRDISPDRDVRIVYGGWINLNTEPESFVCVAKSHNYTGDASGCVRDFTSQEIASFRTTKTKVRIDPGHWIIFHQTIIHSIAAQTVPKDSPLPRLRLYTSVCVGEPLFVERTRHALDTLDIPLIPSGQEPRMVPKLYAVNHQRLWVEFSSYIADDPDSDENSLLSERTMKIGTHRVVRPVLRDCFDKSKLIERFGDISYTECERERFLGEISLRSLASSPIRQI